MITTVTLQSILGFYKLKTNKKMNNVKLGDAFCFVVLIDLWDNRFISAEII